MQNRMKNGFTLAEVLMCVVILGVVFALVMPLVKTTIPDKYEALRKKSDYSLEHIVSDVVNNEDYYAPVKEVSTSSQDGITTTIKHGLQNTYEVTIGEDSFEGDTKFCELVARRFNLMQGSSINCVSTAGFKEDGKTPTFTTIDGVQWILPVSSFTGKTSSANDTISFKTSVDGNGPNCSYDACDPDSCPNPDIFVYNITGEGRLYKDTSSLCSIDSKGGVLLPADGSSSDWGSLSGGGSLSGSSVNQKIGE